MFLLNYLRNIDRNWLCQSYLQGFGLSVVMYLLYLEVSPQMGGILIRPGTDGRKHFSLKGLIPMLQYPFQSLTFWQPQYWDLNFIVFTQVGTILYVLGKYFLENSHPIINGYRM